MSSSLLVDSEGKPVSDDLEESLPLQVAESVANMLVKAEVSWDTILRQTVSFTLIPTSEDMRPGVAVRLSITEPKA